MTITAKIIADSISPSGIRLTTMQLRYPRFIHAEELTHRVIRTTPEIIDYVVPDGVMYDENLSRSASSSRAIPVSRLIDDVKNDPVYPVFWGKNQKGMQALENLEGDDLDQARRLWDAARDSAIKHASDLADIGAHKQIVNRVLEPYAHINVLVTATEWTNFYNLRRHKDAQPEIQALAERMWEAQRASTPHALQSGEWHLPYLTPDEYDLPLGIKKQCSVARCARLSYLTHDGVKPSVTKDMMLYNQLVGSVPLHASPAEHIGTPDTVDYTIHTVDHGTETVWKNKHLHGNLMGWIQLRKQIEKSFKTPDTFS